MKSPVVVQLGKYDTIRTRPFLEVLLSPSILSAGFSAHGHMAAQALEQSQSRL